MPEQVESDAAVVRLDVADRVATLTINRPEVRNALNPQVIAALSEAADRIKEDSAIGAVVITGAGDHFCAGADISFASKQRDERVARAFIGSFHASFRKFYLLPQPVIAAIEGYALGGGCELAMWSDLRVLSATARIGVPEVKIGALPAAGGSQLLTRLLGRGPALELLLTGEAIDAQRALGLNLATRVVEPGQALVAATELAERLAQLPPLALAAIKVAVEAAWLPLPEAVEVGLRLGAELFATDDFHEGTTAFLEKRPPRFVGR